MKPMIRCVAGGLAVLAATGTATAQELPPKAIYQAMLDAAQTSGWVQFRNYAGQQLVYFTALQTLHCRLSEIRYSINSDALDQRFALVPCNPQMAFALPPDAGPEQVYLSLQPGTAETVTVQVVWDDGTESAVMTYGPCTGIGEQSCAQLLAQ
jgi:hypothetical protein